jgi:hypothetical protein
VVTEAVALAVNVVSQWLLMLLLLLLLLLKSCK